MIENQVLELELWGGIECTFNRVGEEFHSQLELSGHDARPSDLQKIRSLGIRTLRYPALWEMAQPNEDVPPNFDWIRARLTEFQKLEMTPIVGFLHHGSGPKWTNLLDPLFPEKFAHYARAFIEKFPEIQFFTPINEPLTTARFSALYGFWYPHSKNPAAFFRALTNQCKATALAMREIRRVNPEAKLVQTEDLGSIQSSAHLDYQARFENERRWLSFDLLAGKVSRKHILFQHLLEHELSEKDLAFFEEDPCSPDLLGINHYVTSCRYLDEEVKFYPGREVGGNGRDRYVDVEQVRVGNIEPTTLTELLEQTWERYQIPMAITESQLACTREEQLRWLWYCWQSAKNARQKKIPVRAVTAWALLGSHSWQTLCTTKNCGYEAGAFDLRFHPMRKTALGHLIEDLAQARKPAASALLEIPGWWQRPVRAIYRKQHQPPEKFRVEIGASRPGGLVIFGAGGTLGHAFSKLAQLRGLPHYALVRKDADLLDRPKIAEILNDLQPWAIVNAAGYVKVDQAEKEILECFNENVAAAEILADEAANRKVRFLTFSSDLVFSGVEEGRGLKETAEVKPLNVYGRSKAEAEVRVLSRFPQALVVRTSAFFGPWDEHNFLTVTLAKLKRSERVQVPCDLIITPTYVPDLVHASLDLLIDGEMGIWHLSNENGALSWYDFAFRAAEKLKLPTQLLIPVPASELPYLVAQRPRNSSLESEKAKWMPDLELALENYLREAFGGEFSRVA